MIKIEDDYYNVIHESSKDTFREALEEAVKLGVDLRSARIENEDLRDANLENANFVNAIISCSHLHKANLRNACLRGANLSYSIFTGADLRGAFVRGSNLMQSKLDEVDLRDANLEWCSMICTDFRGADLRGASLLNATLKNTKLLNAKLENAKLDWKSEGLISGVLHREADTVARKKVAGILLASPENILCEQATLFWELMATSDQEREWVLDVLAKYVVEGDNAPEVLRQRAESRR